MLYFRFPECLFSRVNKLGFMFRGCFVVVVVVVVVVLFVCLFFICLFVCFSTLFLLLRNCVVY